LEKALADSSPEVATTAAHALCRLDRPDRAVPVLVRLLRHESPWVRLASANVLDRIGKQACPALGAMRQASADESPANLYVRWTLAHALKHLGE
jgi:HEAT repeat protein